MRPLKISESITSRSNRSLDVYLHEVSKYKLISGEEEASLAARIRGGDGTALNRLINANLRFVVSVAKQYQHQGLVLEDLINEGNMGLVKAATRFDETKGFKFISYAVWWIRQSIMAAISTQSRTVRLPGNQVSDLIKLKQSQSKLEQRLEREPGIDELASELGVSVDKVKRALTNAEKQISLHAPSVFAEDVSLLDVLSDEHPPTDHHIKADFLRTHVQTLLEKLSPRERLVLTMFYGLQNTESKNLDEISRHLGLTRERIRQIKMKALMQLQKLPGGRSLFSYLE
ncbi:sigma-70 family RNA polymerase sigma factor [Parapedobacter sp. DT-150]|uniref:sigma-70 family RNA polymerase sigma factor n=1 Tax=Parapedobacter sp. DT-150 TaxID=3396162 RepID=UPI003F1B447B